MSLEALKHMQPQARSVVEPEVRQQQSSLRAVRQGSRTAAEHQVQVYLRLDLVIASASQQLDKQPACAPGCSYCCHYHVAVTPPEAFAIAQHVAQLPAGQKEETITAKVQANAQKSDELGQAAYMQTNVPCAFLSAQGQCSIYTLRPLSCRRHHSFDVGVCRETFDNPESQAQSPQAAPVLFAAQSINMAGALASREEGFETTQYELHGAVLEALTNKASIKRWKDGKTAFPSVRGRDQVGALLGLE